MAKKSTAVKRKAFDELEALRNALYKCSTYLLTYFDIRQH